MIVIVPIARLENVRRVRLRWAAQTRVGSELLFVPAPGIELPPLGDGDSVAEPAGTIGGARNVGLRHARDRGHGWAVFWDDDNYYGPDYLAEIEREREGHDVLSKGLAFVQHDSGLWKYETPLRFFPGHSTAVRVAEALDFPEWSLSEDVEWSRRMLAKGATWKHLPPWGLVYYRENPEEHAYDASEAIFLRAHGPARYLGAGLSVDSPFDTNGYRLRHAEDDAVFRDLEKRSRLARFK